MPERFRPNQLQFPLLDEDCRIAGWTASPPYFEGTVLRHPEAERLIGTPIVIMPALLRLDIHMLTAGGRIAADGMWVLSVAHANCMRRMPIVIDR